MPEPLNLGLVRRLHERTQTEREATRDVLMSSAAKIRAAMDSEERRFEELGAAQSKVLEDINDAFDNLDVISRFPGTGKLADVIGIFNPDFNRSIQANRIKRGEFSLQQVGTQMRAARNQTKRSIDLTKQQVSNAGTLLQLTRNGMLDTKALIEFGFEVEENIHGRVKRQIEGASMATLKEWMANPESAPSDEIRRNPGLLKASLIDRLSSEFNLDAVRIANTSNSIRANRLMREEAFSNLTDAELVEEATRPSGKFNPNQVAQEISRREERAMNMRSLRLAVEADDLDLAQRMKQEILVNQTSVRELTHMLAAASANNGELKLDGVQFKQEEIRKARIAKQQQDFADQQSLDEIILAGAGMDAMSKEINGQLKGIHALTNPGVPYDPVNPTAHVPDDIEVAMTRFAERAEAAMLAGSATAMINVHEEMANELKEKREEIIKNYPKAQQGAVREYISNTDSPRISNPAHAAAYVNTIADNPMVLATDPLWNEAWQRFSSEFQSLVNDPGEADIPLEERQDAIANAVFKSLLESEDVALRDKQSLVYAEEAINKLGLREEMRARFFSDHVSNTLAVLEQEAPEIWEGFYNPQSGQFSREIMQPVEEGSNELGLSYTRLNVMLAQRTQAMQEKGILKSDDKLSDVLYERMRQTLGAVNSKAEDNINSAALMNLLFNNRADVAVMEVIAQAASSPQDTFAMDVAAGERERVLALRNAYEEAQETLEDPQTHQFAKKAAREKLSRADNARNQLSDSALRLLEAMEKE